MPANLAGPRRLATARAGRVSATPPAAGPYPATGSLPRWRALLEARWQARLQQVIALSLAFHDAAAAVNTSGARSSSVTGQGQLRALMRRTVAARRALADIDEALARLAAGRFGCCEQCSAAIPPARLARTPETRYCPTCASPAVEKEGKWAR